MTKINTVLDAFKEYQNQVIALGKPGEAKNMQTVLLRFTIAGWGGPIPQSSKRSTKEDVKVGLDFLGTIPIEKLKFGLDVQKQFFDQVSATAHQRNNARYYLRKLINLAEEKGWLKDEQPRTVKLLKLRSGSTPRLPKLTSKKWRYDYSLGSQPDDRRNSKLQAQMSDFKDWFIAQNMTQSTIDTHLASCNRFLGWLVRYEHINLDDLCLEMIIPYINLPKRSQFSSRLEYLEAKDDAIDIRKEKMEDAYKCIKRFLSFYSNNPGSRVTVLTALVNIVKFFYEDLIDSTDPLTTPSILPKLRELRNHENKKIANTPRVVPIEKKFVDYERVLQVVFTLKEEADQNVYSCRRKTRVYQKPRLPKGTGKALRRFLIVGFLSFLPPDRQQLIRELKIGSSFARGTFGREHVIILERIIH